MPVALRFTAPSPKTKVLGREKTSLSGRLPAVSVVCSAPGKNVAQRRSVCKFIVFIVSVLCK